jgi:hypothetical protein
MMRDRFGDDDDEGRRPSPEETRRLLDSFNRIASDELRQTVMDLAHRYASKSPDFNRAMQKMLTKVGTKH